MINERNIEATIIKGSKKIAKRIKRITSKILFDIFSSNKAGVYKVSSIT